MTPLLLVKFLVACAIGVIGGHIWASMDNTWYKWVDIILLLGIFVVLSIFV